MGHGIGITSTTTRSVKLSSYPYLVTDVAWVKILSLTGDNDVRSPELATSGRVYRYTGTTVVADLLLKLLFWLWLRALFKASIFAHLTSGKRIARMLCTETKMASEKFLDELVNFLGDPMFQIPVRTFMDENCLSK